VPEFTVNPSDIMVKFTSPEDRVVHGPGKVTDGVTDRVTDAERRILDELIIDGLFFIHIRISFEYNLVMTQI
jgi:hypothetical protein